MTTEKDGTQDRGRLPEYGYNDKQVILKQYVLGADGTGSSTPHFWQRRQRHGREGGRRRDRGEDRHAEPDLWHLQGAQRGGPDGGRLPAERLTFTVPNPPTWAAGKVAVLTGDNENLKALAKDGTTELHDVSGYYLFDQLPTAVRTWNSTAKKYEYARLPLYGGSERRESRRRHVPRCL